MAEIVKGMPGRTPARVSSMAKQPPHSTEAEQSVLGGLMLENKRLDAVNLRPDDFYRADHQLIFEAITDVIREKGETCDFVTLSEHLRANGKLDLAGGIEYLGSLATETYGVANIVSYAGIVRDNALLRGVIKYGADAMEAGYAPGGREPAEIVSELMLGLDRLHRRKASTVKNFAEVMDAAEQTIEANAALRKAGGQIGAPFGLPCIDRRTGGLAAPRFWILAGRPSLGKSALANQFAENAARHGFPGYLASLEMDYGEIGIRARAKHAQVNYTRLTWGAEKERADSAAAAAELGTRPIYVDTSSVYLSELTSQIIAMKIEHGIKWAIVDNIQLVEVENRGNRGDRVQDLSLISRTLKKLTIKLGIPIMAVSHLGRAVEKDRRKPALSDLKDCGSLEQDADVVCFLHSDDDDTEADKEIKIGFGKNRVGRKGWCKEKVIFRGAVQRFDEIAPDDSQTQKE